jgi:FkbM family methyltransferase
MAMMSKSGLWRIPSAYYAIKGGYPWNLNKWGRFKCADLASTIQFMPGWEPMVKLEVENCKGLFVDVGANIGFYSVMAAKKGNKVVALEPNPRAFEVLVENLLANRVERFVQPYNFAAWSENGPLRLKEGKHTDVSRVESDGTAIYGARLDSLLKDEEPVLMKLDAEGSEPQILKGCKQTIERCHPRIVFESLDSDHFFECSKALRSYHVTKLDRTNYLAS